MHLNRHVQEEITGPRFVYGSGLILMLYLLDTIIDQSMIWFYERELTWIAASVSAIVSDVIQFFKIAAKSFSVECLLLYNKRRDDEDSYSI